MVSFQCIGAYACATRLSINVHPSIHCCIITNANNSIGEVLLNLINMHCSLMKHFNKPIRGNIVMVRWVN